MIDQATTDMLKSMKMSAMAQEFEGQLSEPAFKELGFEERFGLLVNAEWNRRQNNKLNRYIRDAQFSAPSACVEEIEYHEDRKLDKAQMLRFATCQYIDEGHHIILKGASGNGKTYIACALGNAACRRFKKVQYIRMPELLDELSIQNTDSVFIRHCNNSFFDNKNTAVSGDTAGVTNMRCPSPYALDGGVCLVATFAATNHRPSSNHNSRSLP